MNDLVPFEYESFKVREAVWPDPRTVRFPMETIGRILGATQVRPEKTIARIIQRQPLLQGLGMDVTVTSVLRARSYPLRVYSIDEIYQIAIYSKLPRRNEFLLAYPRLKEAEILGRFQRVAPKDARERYAIDVLDRILSLSEQDSERLKARRELMEAFGRSRDTVARWVRRREAREIPPLRKGRSDAGKLRKFAEELRQRVWAIAAKQPDLKALEIWEIVGKAASYATVCRWRRQAPGREIAA